MPDLPTPTGGGAQVIYRIIDALVGAWHWCGDRREDLTRPKCTCPPPIEVPNVNPHMRHVHIPARNPECPRHGLSWP